MNYNFHTHTKRCGHASGEPEEYIKRAIECGVKVMGFSDHAPYVFPNGYTSGVRVPMNEAADYIAELSALREKYKDDIELHIGFEMEYYPSYFEDMLSTVKSIGAEYLILGQHFIGDEIPDNIHAITPRDDRELLKKYVDCVVEAIKSGAFTYVAHPDMINFTGDKEVFRDEMRRICDASKEYGVPLEINCLGIRDKRIYPNEVFLELAGEEKAPVTIGFDAHDVMNAYDGGSVEKAMEFIEKYGLNYVGMPKIRTL